MKSKLPIDQADAHRASEAAEVATDATLPARGGSSPAIRPGGVLDRFRLKGLLGQGGMGTVMSAHDQELGRDVAIKVLRADTTGGATISEGRTRLLREARAMAKLQHPNVVTIHDVGTIGDEVFLAMELIEGGTLTEWLDAEPREPRDIIAAFVAAGRGLTAAHAEGLVHRDFKPDNVLVADKGGRVAVTDFGVVRHQTSDGTDDSDNSSTAPLDLSMTGEIRGTPLFMAPEQHLARSVDARADQFAFCVALHDALFGEHPFGGDTYVELADNVTSGSLRPAARAGVSARVRTAIRRGLSTDPADRFDSMDQLLAELEYDPRPRQRAIGFGVAAVALVGIGLYGWLRSSSSVAAADSCEQSEDMMATVWSPQRRAAVEQAFTASGRKHAGQTFAIVVKQLDRYATRWLETRAAACEDPRAQGTACVDMRLQELDELVSQLSAADGALVDESIETVYQLGAVDSCDSTTALLADDPEVHRMRRQLARANILMRSTRPDDARAASDALFRDATAADNLAIAGEAQLVSGQAASIVGEDSAAHEAFLGAARSFARAGDDQRTAVAWMFLAQLEGGRRNHELAARYLEAADIASERAGGGPALEARMYEAKASLANFEGRFGDALTHHERALSIREQMLGSQHVSLATPLKRASSNLVALGKLRKGREYLERARTLVRDNYGEDHPSLTAMHYERGVLLFAEARLAEAEKQVRLALASHRRLNPGHAAGGIMYRNYLANIISAAGRHDEAIAMHRGVLEKRIEVFGNDSVYVGNSHNNIGLVLLKTGDFSGAETAFREAHRLWEKALGPENSEVAAALSNLGTALNDQKKHSEAIDVLERAVALRKAAHVAPPRLAGTRFQLARALWSARRDRPKAIQLATSALAALSAGEVPERKAIAEIREWLRARGVSAGD